MRSKVHHRLAACTSRCGYGLLLLFLIGLTTGAYAQSTQTVGERQAVAQSIMAAVRQNENELIDNEVFGKPGGRGGTTATGTLGIGTFATGRLRRSNHDGLNIRPLVTSDSVADDGIRHTFSFKIDEGSVIGNVVFTAPEKVMGGQLKVSAFGGYNWLSLEVKPNAANPGDPGTIGSAHNESVIIGGSVLWSMDTLYAVATAIASWGETRLTDKVGDYPNIHDYRYNVHGFVTSFTAGKVFELAGANGPMLDVRGAIAYTENKNDPFANVFGDEFRIRFATWTGTGALTLYTNMPMQDNALFRPFIQGYVRQEFGNDYTLAFTQSGSGAFTLTAYDQNPTYLGVDAGFAYTRQNLTFGASAYYERSGDERTLGGRVRASWQFN